MRHPNEPSEPTKPIAVTPVRPARRSLVGWVVVLPLLLLVGLLAQPGSRPPQVATSPVTAAPTRTPGSDETAAAAAPTAEPAHRQQPPKPASETLESYTIYVPGPDALLHRKVVRVRPSEMERDIMVEGVKSVSPTKDGLYQLHVAHALALLFKDSDSLFPPGTRVPRITAKGNVLTVDFEQGLPNANLWHSEKITQLAVYSIVHTLNAEDLKAGQTPIKVQLLAAGKPLEVLGELDVSEPLEPNPQLVAQS